MPTIFEPLDRKQNERLALLYCTVGEERKKRYKGEPALVNIDHRHQAAMECLRKPERGLSLSSSFNERSVFFKRQENNILGTVILKQKERETEVTCVSDLEQNVHTRWSRAPGVDQCPCSQPMSPTLRGLISPLHPEPAVTLTERPRRRQPGSRHKSEEARSLPRPTESSGYLAMHPSKQCTKTN